MKSGTGVITLFVLTNKERMSINLIEERGNSVKEDQDGATDEVKAAFSWFILVAETNMFTGHPLILIAPDESFTLNFSLSGLKGVRHIIPVLLAKSCFVCMLVVTRHHIRFWIIQNSPTFFLPCFYPTTQCCLLTESKGMPYRFVCWVK